MGPRRRAILFLPSPQGLLEYDVLEEAAFLGPAPQRGLAATPSPFPTAVATLTWADGAFEVRALPGETPPEVNGKPADGARLKDGDRVRLGEHVMLFRTAASARPAASAETEATPEAPRRPAVTRRPAGAPVSRGGRGWATALGLLAGLVLLTAAWRAVEHVKGMKASKDSARVPDPPPLRPEDEPSVDRAARDFAAIRAMEEKSGETVESFDELIGRYEDFRTRWHPGSPEADAAVARVRELREKVALKRLARLESELPERYRRKDYESLLVDLQGWDRRYGSTGAAKGADALRDRVRRDARAALDALVARAGPLVTTNPRAAQAEVLTTNLRLPPDMASEVAVLLERIDSVLRATSTSSPGSVSPTTPERGPGLPGPTPRRPTPEGPEPRPGPTDPKPPPPGPAVPIAPDPEVVQAWRAARDDLLAGRYEPAVAGYTALLQKHAGSRVVQDGRSSIEAGLKAASVGANGPAALLAGKAQFKAGRLECEYVFDDPALPAQDAVAKDFIAVKPFPSDLPENVVAKDGVVRLSGASGLFHTVVYGNDVRIEAETLPEVARDFGAIALEDGDLFRAVLFDVANTQFKLKKGDAARVQPGHVMWFMGEGTWSASDSGMHGFIKIAERTTSKLVAGEPTAIEFERKRDRVSGSFQAKSDDVRLEGTVRGDDGKGMGSAYVGLFTNGGILAVRRVKISGVVDDRWLQAKVKELVALDPGPR